MNIMHDNYNTTDLRFAEFIQLRELLTFNVAIMFDTSLQSISGLISTHTVFYSKSVITRFLSRIPFS